MASITQRGKSYLIRVSDGFDLGGKSKILFHDLDAGTEDDTPAD